MPIAIGSAIRVLALTLAALACFGAQTPVQAGAILQRVRADNAVRCRAEARPGFAEATEAGIGGLAVDLCRAVAIALLGPAGRIDFRLLEAEPDFEAARAGAIELMFVTGGLIAEHRLGAEMIPGPPVFVDRFALMVPTGSEVRSPQGLKGRTICFMIASPAQRALEAAAETLGIGFSRLGFEEDVEMRDAYNVGRCQAIVDQATRLALIRQDGGVNRVASRFLEPPLGLDPVFAATPVEDGQWAAAVSWLMQGLIAASAPHSDWHGAETGLEAASASALGLREHWRADIARVLGTYADMLRRHTGAGSPLELAVGPNAPWPAGLLLTPAVP